MSSVENDCYIGDVTFATLIEVVGKLADTREKC
jgi:hypothetical protein